MDYWIECYKNTKLHRQSYQKHHRMLTKWFQWIKTNQWVFLLANLREACRLFLWLSSFLLLFSFLFILSPILFFLFIFLVEITYLSRWNIRRMNDQRMKEWKNERRKEEKKKRRKEEKKKTKNENKITHDSILMEVSNK